MNSFLKKNGAWIGFLVLAGILAIATEGGFLTERNLTNMMRQASINGILAGGMTLVILTGGIDLSIGSVVALCGILIGVSQVHWGWTQMGATGAFLSVLLSVGAGLFSGLLTGGLISWLRIAPFIITLGLMVIARGLAMIFSDGGSISPMGPEFELISGAYLPTSLTVVLVLFTFVVLIFQTYKMGKKQWTNMIFPLITFILLGYSFIAYRGFPVLVLFLAATLLLLHGLLKFTTFGRGVFAVGSNEKASYWAGVPIKKVTVVTYAIMGTLAGLAGALLTSRLNGSDPNAGQLFELDAIAAVVIGGTSLRGGQGSIMGTFIGVLMIASLNNGMDLLGVPSFYQMVCKGLIIIVAVSLDRSQRRPVV
jgi:D-xylose transport system permease protein